MNNDDLNKSLANAMGDLPEQEQPASTSKRTLKGPMVEKKQADATPISEPVRESFEEMKLRAKLEALQELLAEERAIKRTVKTEALKAEEAEPEEKVKFTVNLPVQANNIRLDGREYYHGHTYDVPKRQAISMRDIQFMAWKHDEQVRGYRGHPDGVRTGGMAINADGQAISQRVY